MTEDGATLLSFLIRHGRHLCSQSHALQPPLQPQQQQQPPPLPPPPQQLQQQQNTKKKK